MNLELVKFVPPDIRLEIAQKIIQESGIRPLAREIEVDPKSVYKYKEGSSRPGDEVMSKLLALTKRDFPDMFDEYISKLDKSFSEALNSPIRPEEILSSGAGGFVGRRTVARKSTESTARGRVDRETTKKSVDQESTKKRGEPSVDREPTKETGKGEAEARTEEHTETSKEIEKELSFDDLCDRIGVTNPFDRRKVEKIVDSFEEKPELSFSEIIELTGLSENAVEKYLDELTSEGLVKETSSESYKINTKIGSNR